uniref:Uncharacterized protein n=1 Tax=Trichuris muris TaxID=70415 RepID=A0A5S6QVK4_TRIMR
MVPTRSSCKRAGAQGRTKIFVMVVLEMRLHFCVTEIWLIQP